MNREVWDCVTKLADFVGIREPKRIKHIEISPREVTVTRFVENASGRILTDAAGNPVTQTFSKGWDQ